MRNRGAVDLLCAKLEKVLIEHRVRTLAGSTLVADTHGRPLLTIQQVERLVIAWLVGNIEEAAVRLKHLGGIRAAFEDGLLLLRPDPRGLGRRPLIINADGKVLLELSDAAAAASLEIACDLADPRRAGLDQHEANAPI